MKYVPLIALTLASALFGVSAHAQDKPAAPMHDMAMSAPTDCGKANVKRHDHGAERGAPSSSTALRMPCAEDKAASAPAATENKKNLKHDHAKFHKNQ
jgi:hypothetical protein